MEKKDIKWCPQHGYPLPCNKCGMPLPQYTKQEENGVKKDWKDTQMEMYKAGIKEVVEWIDEDAYQVHRGYCNLGSIPVYLIHKEQWENKKKEWGI